MKFIIRTLIYALTSVLACIGVGVLIGTIAASAYNIFRAFT
nr:MAG TPA: hypothetical protein [Caudoviricetes sp.]